MRKPSRNAGASGVAIGGNCCTFHLPRRTNPPVPLGRGSIPTRASSNQTTRPFGSPTKLSRRWGGGQEGCGGCMEENPSDVFGGGKDDAGVMVWVLLCDARRCGGIGRKAGAGLAGPGSEGLSGFPNAVSGRPGTYRVDQARAVSCMMCAREAGVSMARCRGAHAQCRVRPFLYRDTRVLSRRVGNDEERVQLKALFSKGRACG